MGSIVPTVTISSTPAIQVTMVGAITFNEFINTLGIYVYLVKLIFMQALTTQQINQNLTYHIINPNGMGKQKSITPSVDPYQKQATYSLDLTGEKIILNGFSTIGFTILAGETVMLILCSDQKNLQDALNAISADNFKMVQGAVGNTQLFKSLRKCP
ncbi:MAG TPA: hypothetical protein VFV08_08420 [Puia sp.]|nr:hypothetical protein [Puia sp.]